ncbi:TRM11 family SAM-dependent methyltransferase [Diplocloster modestus]|uniref:Methyltransferase n=1 Tax=Diplocloster modestus TaxID=2850322 RepID=A0ABS6KCA6_9FIRM|nr:methyltransferase [Diplocloster modestus]MBU9728149.1 methyltransferase [Diplocloster modestus]
MVIDLWKAVTENADVRQNLSKLRMEIKQRQGKEELRRCIKGDEERLVELLRHEDAKTRKNAALLMGELGDDFYLESLYEAYEAEPQRFVKSSYLSAMKNMDCKRYRDQLNKRLDLLLTEETNPENQKHLTEEIRSLSDLLVGLQGVKQHSFRGMDETYDIILLTNRDHQDITLRELEKYEPRAQAKPFGAGVTARVSNLSWINKIRTYQELLFVVKGLRTCPAGVEEAARTIVQSGIFDLLNKAHRGEPPYYFRIEVKSKMQPGARGILAKGLSARIEQMSGRRLINSVSSYEVEIRLIENRAGDFNVLVKLFTVRDDRFSYRKEVTAASIKPVNAALTAALAMDYLKEDAAVLDPFCGVGTMLIERHRALKANTSYGIDFLGEAVQKARLNTEAAGQIIHYVHRDFFDFRHEYLFDEIFTDMPFRTGQWPEEEIRELYRKFFPAAARVLKADGTAVLYTHNRDDVRNYSAAGGFRLKEEFVISKKEGTYVMILRRDS